MEANKMIRDLRNVEQKNKDKHVFTGEINISIMARDTANLIEAQQQEIDRLEVQVEADKDLIRELNNSYINSELNLSALISDKDEQAGRIIQLDNGLKKLRSSLQWLKETIHDLDYKAWAEDNIGKIDALLGGDEDGK